jgi:hypothetical protein
MILLFLICALFPASVSARAQTNEQRALVLVIGAAGEAEYGEQFSAAAELWKQAAAKGGLQTFVLGQDKENPENDRAKLLGVLTNEVAKPLGELWLVFIGHGTFDGRLAKFNLRGPDISATDLAAALTPCIRPMAVINCASASGPFINALSAPGRAIITRDPQRQRSQRNSIRWLFFQGNCLSGRGPGQGWSNLVAGGLPLCFATGRAVLQGSRPPGHRTLLAG